MAEAAENPAPDAKASKATAGTEAAAALPAGKPATTAAAPKADAREQAPAKALANDGQTILTARKLPAVFEMEWVNPFTKQQEASGTQAEPAPDAAGLSFPSCSLTVSAVLITGNSKKVVIDRQILTEGDSIPSIGAVVKTISPNGVELKLANKTVFLKLGGASSSSTISQQ